MSASTITPVFLPGKEIRKRYGVSNTTLQRWHRLGKVSCVRTIGRCRRYITVNVKVEKKDPDRLQGKIDSKDTRARERYRLRRVAARIREQIKNRVDDVHRKLVKHLVENFDVILLPTFETSQMVKKKGTRRRVINKKVVRQMLTWRHYDIKRRLLDKARGYPWVKIVIVGEEYTSKTCGWCGVLHTTLGGNKHFHCKSCGTAVGRDINGARNILIKNHEHCS